MNTATRRNHYTSSPIPSLRAKPVFVAVALTLITLLVPAVISPTFQRASAQTVTDTWGTMSPQETSPLESDLGNTGGPLRRIAANTFPELGPSDAAPGYWDANANGADNAEGASIDLLAVAQLAAGKDLNIQFMREKLRESAADERLEAVSYLPDVGLFAEFVKHEGRIQGTVGDLPRASKQSLFTGVQVEWVYDFSQQRYNKLAASQQRRADEANLRATRADRLHRAANHYFELVGAVAAQGLASESVRRGVALVSYQSSLASSGKGLEADVKRADAFRAERAQDLAQAEASQAVLSIGLATQLRLDPFTQLIPAEISVQPVRWVDPSSTGGPRDLVQLALKQRPELTRDRLLQAAAGTLHDEAATGRFLPTLSGEARVGGFGGDSGSGLRRYDDRQDYRIGIEWETDNLGKGDAARIEQRSAQAGQARVREQQTRDQITEEVLSAWNLARAAEKKMGLAVEQVTAASASLSLSSSRLQSGLAIPYEVIEAEEGLVRARNNHVQAIVDFNKAELELLRSIGGIAALLKN